MLRCCERASVRQTREPRAFRSHRHASRVRSDIMTRIYWLIVSFLTLSTLTFAQDKLITLDDIFSPDPNVRVRFGGTPVSVQWAADGRSFRQVVNGKLMRVDALSGQAVPYYDADSLAAALMHVGVK